MPTAIKKTDTYLALQLTKSTTLETLAEFLNRDFYTWSYNKFSGRDNVSGRHQVTVASQDDPIIIPDNGYLLNHTAADHPTLSWMQVLPTDTTMIQNHQHWFTCYNSSTPLFNSYMLRNYLNSISGIQMFLKEYPKMQVIFEKDRLILKDSESAGFIWNERDATLTDSILIISKADSRYAIVSNDEYKQDYIQLPGVA